MSRHRRLGRVIRAARRIEHRPYRFAAASSANEMTPSGPSGPIRTFSGYAFRIRRRGEHVLPGALPDRNRLGCEMAPTVRTPHELARPHAGRLARGGRGVVVDETDAPLGRAVRTRAVDGVAVEQAHLSPGQHHVHRAALVDLAHPRHLPMRVAGETERLDLVMGIRNDPQAAVVRGRLADGDECEHESGLHPDAGRILMRKMELVRRMSEPIRSSTASSNRESRLSSQTQSNNRLVLMSNAHATASGRSRSNASTLDRNASHSSSPDASMPGRKPCS